MVTDAQLAEVNQLIDNGEKTRAVQAITSLLALFFRDVQENQGPWNYMGTPLGEAFQSTLARVRDECPDECNASSVEVLRFQLGDRVYGYNLDESAVLFLLGQSLGAGNLIIDHVNDHYREGGELDETTQNPYGPAWVDSPTLSTDEQNDLIKSYLDFYKRVPKLSEVPQETVTGSTDRKLATLMINRACKSGILKTVLSGHTVHFNLDHFISDPSFSERAITKGEKTAQGSVPAFFTVKELRFIKRLHDLDPDLGRHVKFYQDGSEVPAPWVTNAASWERYQRSKTSHGLENTLKEIKKSKVQEVVSKFNSIASVVSMVASEAVSAAIENVRARTDDNSSGGSLS